MTLQDTAPSAVRIAEAIDTIICTANLMLSFLVMITSFLLYTVPEPVEGLIIIGVILVAATATGITACVAACVAALVGVTTITPCGS
jgi:hypothetical protein